MTTNYDRILNKRLELKPKQYSKNRNYIDGSVSRLSPYISRGVISTKQIFTYLYKNYKFYECEKFIQELFENTGKQYGIIKILIQKLNLSQMY